MSANKISQVMRGRNVVQDYPIQWNAGDIPYYKQAVKSPFNRKSRGEQRENSKIEKRWKTEYALTETELTAKDDRSQ